ncbi:hypothetical protein J6590_107751 [Homalodisca vitripennis]|nr:hypothetical protein J6590_107751 [Homalodisca vitripennis]
MYQRALNDRDRDQSCWPRRPEYLVVVAAARPRVRANTHYSGRGHGHDSGQPLAATAMSRLGELLAARPAAVLVADAGRWSRPRPRQRPAARGQFNIKNNVTTRTKRLRPRRGHLAAATRIFCLGRRGHIFEMAEFEFDTERFILAIKERPSLWNMLLDEYSDKNIKKKMWEEVTLLFGGSGCSNTTEKNKLYLKRVPEHLKLSVKRQLMAVLEQNQVTPAGRTSYTGYAQNQNYQYPSHSGSNAQFAPGYSTTPYGYPSRQHTSTPLSYGASSEYSGGDINSAESPIFTCFDATE